MDFFGEEIGCLVFADHLQFRCFRNDISNAQIRRIVSDDENNLGLVQLFHNLKDPVFQMTV